MITFYAPVMPCPHPFTLYLQQGNRCNNDAQSADMLLLPFMYELIYDYSQKELDVHGIEPEQLQEMKECAAELDSLSVKLNRKLAVLFFRDPWHPLPFRNALVFRTSGRAANLPPGNYGLPAFIHHKPGNIAFYPVPKEKLPAVSFRGNAAPEKLNLSVAVRDWINFSGKAHLGFRVKNC